MLMDKKKLAASVVGKLRSKDLEGKTEMSDVAKEYDEEIGAIASSLISALEAKDKNGVISALKAFYYKCEAEEDEGPEV